MSAAPTYKPAFRLALMAGLTGVGLCALLLWKASSWLDGRTESGVVVTVDAAYLALYWAAASVLAFLVAVAVRRGVWSLGLALGLVAIVLGFVGIILVGPDLKVYVDAGADGSAVLGTRFTAPVTSLLWLAPSLLLAAALISWRLAADRSAEREPKDSSAIAR